MDKESMKQVTLNTLRTYRIIAQNPNRRGLLLKDTGCLSFLVYVLDDDVFEVVHDALQILLMLTERPEHCRNIKSTYGITQALNTLTVSNKTVTDDIRKLVEQLFERFAAAETTALKDVQNSMENLNVTGSRSDTSSHTDTPRSRMEGTKSNVMFKKPVNTRFMGTGGRAKTLTFELHGLSEENRRHLEEKLVPLKGVISIYFDMHNSRCVVRAKLEVKPEVIAANILQTELFTVNQVVKDDMGQETLVEMTEREAKTDKENEINESQLPDYLPEDFGNSPSPKSGAQDRRLARTGRQSNSKDAGWWGSVTDFISNSFYW